MEISRKRDFKAVRDLHSIFPVAAILGPRQCGKTTLARQFPFDHYFDLEKPRDLAMLDNPQLVLENRTGLIVIDEIQRLPEIFPLLRYLVDSEIKQRYLILGSASGELLRQSSESLAGRIGYYHLGGLTPHDAGSDKLEQLWLRGGFPRSYTAGSDRESRIWREQYIRTFLERDIPQLGISIPSRTLGRFWTMLSHYHGQILNYSDLARSFGISDVTVRKYIEILEGTFMIRLLQPWHTNTGKRLVKRPKLYLRDSGIFHTLQDIESMDQLLGHIKLGASWEGFALETVSRSIGKRDEELFFWKTHTGAEADLFWRENGKNWAVEFKFSDTPRLEKSMMIAMHDLELEKMWVVYPGKESWPLDHKIQVLPLASIGAAWEY